MTVTTDRRGVIRVAALRRLLDQLLLDLAAELHRAGGEAEAGGVMLSAGLVLGTLDRLLPDGDEDGPALGLDDLPAGFDVWCEERGHDGLFWCHLGPAGAVGVEASGATRSEALAAAWAALHAEPDDDDDGEWADREAGLQWSEL